MDPDLFNNFVTDQQKLSEALARGEELYASIPMSINDLHPIEGFRGHSFIPVTIAYSGLETKGKRLEEMDQQSLN